MILTKSTDYAVRALCYLSRNSGRLVSVKELHEKLAVPYPFLRKLLQMLNKKKIVNSYKGSGGGFELNKSAGEIFLPELIEIFQGPFKINHCTLKGKNCPNMAYCVLRTRMDEVEAQVYKMMKDISIKELCKDPRKRGGV